MTIRSTRIANWIDSRIPPGTPARKVLLVVAVILLTEGFSVLLLFSYLSPFLGFISLVLGALLLLFLGGAQASSSSEIATPGIILIERVFRRIGGDFVMIILGSIVVLTVLIYNISFSPRPGIGDSDTIVIILGSVMMLYPALRRRYRTEAAFSLIFLGCVGMFLVLPQLIMSLSPAEGDPALGNWYVHYMLAAPFAGILDLLGIPSSSVGNLVTIQFQDGSIHTLSISAYCAGLYSFSIFLSAFIAFVLVFERLPYRAMLGVLTVGLLVAYLGNLLRMVAVGAIGYFRGLDALRWAHENVGWIIFLAWSSLFWWLTLGYVSRYSVGNGESTSAAE
jgi:archaeosortase C (PEF-CTERM variant)